MIENLLPHIAGTLFLLLCFMLTIILFCFCAAMMPYPFRDVEAEYWEKKWEKMVKDSRKEYGI